MIARSHGNSVCVRDHARGASAVVFWMSRKRFTNGRPLYGIALAKH